MANRKPKATPQERLAMILKQGSSIPELANFRSQARDVYSLGGVMGLYEWIEARRDWDLLHPKSVLLAADTLQFCCGSVIDAATIKPKPKPKLTSEERLQKIIQREEHARNSIAPVGYRVKQSLQSRMMVGFDKRLDELIKFAQRSG